MFKYESCRCCDNNNITEWLTLPDSPVANALFDKPNHKKYILNLNYCEKCGHVQLKEAPDPKEVFATYRYKSGISKSFRDHFDAYANFAYDKFNLNQDSHVLEIGSNDGYLLKQFKLKGCKVQGVEPSQNLFEEYFKNKIPLHYGFFETRLVNAMNWHNKFDLVCANNVLAHIPDTHDVIKGISDCLKENGVLLVECGHRDAIINGTHLDNVYHEHIDYYSPHSFGTLLSQYGLMVEHVENINSHGLSFRLTARKCSSKSITSFEYVNIADCKNIVMSKIAERKQNIDKIINGRPFVAYGAAAKAVTSLYMLDLVSDSLVGVYDDNELKQGFYFPGTNLKIAPPSSIPLASLVLVTAWNFFEEIKSKLIANGHKGDIVCMQ